MERHHGKREVFGTSVTIIILRNMEWLLISVPWFRDSQPWLCLPRERYVKNRGFQEGVKTPPGIITLADWNQPTGGCSRLTDLNFLHCTCKGDRGWEKEGEGKGMDFVYCGETSFSLGHVAEGRLWLKGKSTWSGGGRQLVPTKLYYQKRRLRLPTSLNYLVQKILLKRMRVENNQ